eukprot:3578296-Amphidinium_carterae.1
MQGAATTWLHTPRGCFLPKNKACRTALRIRLGLPLYLATLACQYTQCPCGHQFDVHGQHAANCSRGPVCATRLSTFGPTVWAQVLRLAMPAHKTLQATQAD